MEKNVKGTIKGRNHEFIFGVYTEIKHWRLGPNLRALWRMWCHRRKEKSVLRRRN